MTFTEELRMEADPIFEAIFQHPFVKGIETGTLKPEQLIHYVKQDFEYLNTFIQIYGLAISRCEKREDMRLFHDKMAFILNEEIHPHNNFCEVAGVNYDELQYEPLAPTALNYTRHMLDVANKGRIGEILAVLLPCPWTYYEIGVYLKNKLNVQEDHPFYEWITFYASTEGTGQFRNRLDEYAETASDAEKKRMKDAFLKSCQLELMFWEMAFTEETWPVKL
ncbi:thiaminase II [Marinilactibacillus sp. Marseille-P9653]|uniref:thiaminase II n=1 Tax=Marinilactibacillus sp. Marseille-P9653 TaxID=2866583 RepID=UPI001CE3DC7B|nr:thiaminase II [Marinilactibacillus sp. Marseille-P9653]